MRYRDIQKIRVVQQGRNLLVAKISNKALGFSPAFVWCPSPSCRHRTDPYPIPKTIRIGTQDSEETGAKFSPPPFAVVVENKEQKILICVRADSGWHLWNFVKFRTTKQGINVQIDFEGHVSLGDVKDHVSVRVLPARHFEKRMDLLSRGMALCYPAAFRKPVNRIPSWWHRPIYCGYGDQVGMALKLEGLGSEYRALAYCTQGLYERWIKRLEETRVPIGTIIIDAGWSPAGIWQPNPAHWPDLRGFINRQHKKDRHVLLWIATWLCEGLPDSWCIHAGSIKLVADPGNKQYRSFIQKQIQRLLSSEKDCFNADGFKIDQLQYTPSEVSPRGGEQVGRSFYLKDKHPPLEESRSKKWGCELLYQLQKTIYCAAKKAKPDALITSSTVCPYFYDTFDMVRLHDTDCVDTDVFSAMKARADLARAVLPNFPIDADNWIHTNYREWFHYTMESYRIGVPCIFYAENFIKAWFKEPLTEQIPLRDLRRIAHQWKEKIGVNAEGGQWIQPNGE